MIIIPMAGLSRRFSEAGYSQPKYMLELNGRPLFDWAVASFASQFMHHSFLFILRDVSGTADFVRARCAALGIAHATIVEVGTPTAGQAETVELGLGMAQICASEPLTIFNIDTIRPHLDTSAMVGYDGWLEVFDAAGDNWSFIATDPNDPARVIRCTEKQRISNHCCTGLYQFASAALFLRALAAERLNPSNSELFVAPLYNYLIENGCNIGWREVPGDKVILSGVPAEYEALRVTLPENMRRMFDVRETL